MKGFGFLVIFLVTGIGLTCLLLSSKGSASNFFPDMLTNHGDAMVVNMKSRKLKDTRGGSDGIYLNDYRPIDPTPSSKASIRPGPVEHGTPLMPYIPKPAPSPPPDRR